MRDDEEKLSPWKKSGDLFPTGAGTVAVRITINVNMQVWEMGDNK